MLETLWQWPWGYLPENPILASSVFSGVVLVAIGLLYVVAGLLHGERGPLARFISLDVASWLTTGLVVGLALALITSVVFDLVPGSVGQFIRPDNLLSGLAMGLGCGILVGCALGRLGTLPRGPILVGRLAASLSDWQRSGVFLVQQLDSDPKPTRRWELTLGWRLVSSLDSLAR